MTEARLVTGSCQQNCPIRVLLEHDSLSGECRQRTRSRSPPVCLGQQVRPRRTAVWLTAAGLMRTTMSRPVDQTSKQHWPHGLSRPLAGLPPILITDRGNRFFIFSTLRTFKFKKLQNRLQSERNQPRFWAVKLYEAWAVLPPIPAPVLPPDNRPNRRVVHPITALVPPAGIRPAPHKPHHVSTARFPTVCC